MYYLQSRYYDPDVGRFLNADALASTGQGILSFNMFAYCGNNPVTRNDASGTTYEEADEETPPEGFRVVGAGVQLELTMGNITVGLEIIIYWDVNECGENEAIIAVYRYSGGSLNCCDELLGSITATIANNIDLITSGPKAGISKLVEILTNSYSASVSGVLLFGNELFDSVKSYEGPFVSFSGNINHVKGSLAFSSNCFAIGLGGTSSSKSGWGISVTTYTLVGTLKLRLPLAQAQSVAI